MASPGARDEFGTVGTQSRLAAKALAAKSINDGVTWLYNSVLTNGGSSGSLQEDIFVDADSEMELLYGSFQNRDTVARTTDALVWDNNAQVWSWLLVVNLGAGNYAAWPTSEGGSGSIDTQQHTGRMIMSGDLIHLRLRVASVAAGQDCEIGVVARVRGKKPTAVPTFSSGGSANVNYNVFA